MKLDYAKDSKIDINALEIEFINLPTIEKKYIKQVSDFKRECIRVTEEKTIAHEELKVVRSKLILKAHEIPDKLFGKAKATGPEVEAYYRTHEDYIQAKQNWIDAESELIEAETTYNTAVSMRDLIHFTKTKALEQLVTLHGQGYFAGPKVPRDVNKEIELKNREKKEIRKRVGKKTGKNLTWKSGSKKNKTDKK